MLLLEGDEALREVVEVDFPLEEEAVEVDLALVAEMEQTAVARVKRWIRQGKVAAKILQRPSHKMDL